jgi:hypothetical protein
MRLCDCQHHQRKTICLYVYISDIRQIVGYRTPVFIQRFPWHLHITITYNIPHLRQCWRCHSNTVDTRSRLPICPDVKTRKRRNVVGIDMIRNKHIEYFIASNSIVQFTSRNSVISLFSLATTDIDLARLRHNTCPSALVSAFQTMKWPNKFLMWSGTSTLPLSIDTRIIPCFTWLAVG